MERRAGPRAGGSPPAALGPGRRRPPDAAPLSTLRPSVRARRLCSGASVDSVLHLGFIMAAEGEQRRSWKPRRAERAKTGRRTSGLCVPGQHRRDLAPPLPLGQTGSEWLQIIFDELLLIDLEGLAGVLRRLRGRRRPTSGTFVFAEARIALKNRTSVAPRVASRSHVHSGGSSRRQTASS